jgi:selenocysteine-specific elongation factor
MATESYRELINITEQHLAEYHRTNPLRLGMPREELRSHLGIKASALATLLEHGHGLQAKGSLVQLSSHAIRFTSAQETRITELFQAIQSAPFTPPSYTDAAAVTGEDVLNALIDLNQIVQVTPDVIFSYEAYEALVSGALDLIDANGSVDARSLRDHFGTSRKYAIALLEHLDTSGVTRRVGDARIRANNA